MAHDDEGLHLKSPQEILRDTDRDSYGVVRITSGAAGTVGEEREYEAGDEALVEAGQAEWVVAPVHLPSAGRRLDAGRADEEARPLGGVEVYPPAEPTSSARRSQARTEGFVEAHSDEGLAERLAAKRSEVARGVRATGEEDVRTQAAVGGLGARTGGGVTAADLVGDEVARGVTPTEEPGQPAKAAKAAKATGGKES